MSNKPKNHSAAYSRRRFLKRIRRVVTTIALVTVVGVGLTAYKRHYDVTHDLSVIGNGVPTVIQVHDTGCQLCQKLRDNVNAVKGEFRDRIQFRIADIHTAEGRALASHYDVPHVTLLLFDSKGELVTTLHGVREPESLRPSFKRLL